jgi:uncharacterized protein YgbK (DUF1537 family)
MTDPPAALLVTADDSTGATEAAAACADAGFDVNVAPFGVPAPAPAPARSCVVVDLRSRHLDPDEARRRMLQTTARNHRMHKIDSTLRGNWAAEIATVVEGGRRVVLIPSHPLAGRVCIGGVVFVEGAPVAESELGNDPRLPVRSSRPAEALRGVELDGSTALTEWLARARSGIAIVDARTIAEIEQLVTIAFDAADVLLAGPASVVGAFANVSSTEPTGAQLPEPRLPKPIVVVSASLHPISRAQIAEVERAGIDVVTSSVVRGGDSAVVAAQVAERAHRLVTERRARSVILVGGDTAEAFIGDTVVHVFGSIDVGVSLGEALVRGTLLRIASKPGGFGTANTLVDLVNR